MRSYIVRRLVATVIVFWAVLTLVFLLLQWAPGDAALSFGLDRSLIGLDQPLHIQYWHYLTEVLRGDLGESWITRFPVSEMIRSRAVPTLELALLTAVAATFVGIGLGLLAARKKGSFLDGLIRSGTIVGTSIPSFWLGLLLLMVFGLYIPGVLPAGGWVPFSESPVQNILHLILPAFVLGLSTIAMVAHTLRISILDALERDYVTFARSMGVSEARVIRQVALPNAIIPTTTVIGLLVGLLISGAVIVESVFTIPGVGRLMVQSFRRQDIPVAVGATLFVAIFVLALNFVVDILSAYLNPKIRDLYVRSGRAR